MVLSKTSMPTKLLLLTLLGCMSICTAGLFSDDLDDSFFDTNRAFHNDDDTFDAMGDLLNQDMNGFGDDDFTAFHSRRIQNLTTDAFKSTIAHSTHFVVLFMSKKTAEDNPKFDEFFTSLAPYLSAQAMGDDVSLGRVVIEDCSDLSHYFRPDEYPAIVFYDHVRKFQYEDELDVGEFFTWYGQVTMRELIDIRNQKDFDTFMALDNNPKLIGFLGMRHHAEIDAVNELSKEGYLTHLDIRRVGICSDDCQISYMDKSFPRPSLVLFRNFDKEKPYVVLNKNLEDAEEIYHFCTYESLPPVLVYDELNQTKLFGETIDNHLILALDANADNDDVITEFKKSANFNRDQQPQRQRIIHVIYYFDSKEDDILQNFLSINENTPLPRLFLTETALEENEIRKFKLKDNEKITLESIKNFLTQYKEGRLNRFYISEELPLEPTVPRKLVGSNYQAQVASPNEDVVVFHCPDLDSTLCEAPFAVFRDAAMRNLHDNLVYAYVDLAKNEIEIEPPEEFPEVMIYLAGKKHKPKSFRPAFSSAELGQWVQKMRQTRDDDVRREEESRRSARTEL